MLLSFVRKLVWDQSAQTSQAGGNFTFLSRILLPSGTLSSCQCHSAAWGLWDRVTAVLGLSGASGWNQGQSCLMWGTLSVALVCA